MFQIKMPPQDNLRSLVNKAKNQNVSSNIIFTINGKEFNVTSSVSPSTKLVDFIRKEANLSGTKILCREAGCGACTVSATCLDLETGNPKSFSVRAVSK